MKPFIRRLNDEAKAQGFACNDGQHFPKQSIYPEETELFDWDFGGDIGLRRCVAFDFPCLLPSTNIFIHQMRPEDDAKFWRVAQVVSRHGHGAIFSYWWGQESSPFPSMGYGFHSMVVPADIPVYIEAILPTLIHEQLVQV